MSKKLLMNSQSTLACGVEVDFTTGTCKRLEYLEDDFSSISPYKDMKRCNILDGNVVAYNGDETYKEDGTNGDVMVEIPKFYYKVVPITTQDNPAGDGLQMVKGQWWVSAKPIKGYKVHPAFIRNNKEVEKIYVSAYEGSLYDTSESKFILDDAQVADFDVDKLVSIAGAKPCSGLTQNLNIINVEKLCNNKGEGYIQFDFTMTSALQLLMLIEYASFDTQAKIGNGVVGISDVSTENCAINTGETSNLGNASGYNVNDNKHSISYHGIENPYGNIWKFVSGLNIEAKGIHKAYWSNDDKTVNTATNHNQIAFTLCKTNGNVTRIGYDVNNDFVFLPTSTTGSSIVKDYYYQYNSISSWLVALLGGGWGVGSVAGGFAWDVNNGSGIRVRGIGARLAFFKK